MANTNNETSLNFETDIPSLIDTSVRKAAALMLEAKNIHTEGKTSARDVVTEYDVAVQKLLISEFKSAVPDAHFFCEEGDTAESFDAKHVFIIDPIDGTMNFSRGMNYSCISVAYMLDGTITHAAIYNPYADEMFTACLGKGAYLNGRPIHVFEGELKEGLACIGTAPYYHELRNETLRVIEKAYDNTLDIRRGGTAALDLCTVASGRAVIYCELFLSFWDYAAGMLIVSEAGGYVCTKENMMPPTDGTKSSILAGNKKAVLDFLAL